MPAKSKSQQRFMGMVSQCKKSGDCASPAVQKAADGMKSKDVKKYAETKHRGLPDKVTENKMTFKDFLLNENMDNSGFNRYMQQVDRILLQEVGMEHMDLPDYMWMDAYEDGVDPREAVRNFIEFHDEGMDFSL